jgi:hypothetical protein
MLTMIFHLCLLARMLKCVAEFSLADHLSAIQYPNVTRGT